MMKIMRFKFLQVSREDGGVVIRVCIFAVVLAVVLWLGYKLVPIYYHYLDLRNHMSRALSEGAVASDEELRRMLVPIIKQHAIPAEARDLVIERADPMLSIRLPYQERLELSVMGRSLTLWRFDLVASAQGRYR